MSDAVLLEGLAKARPWFAGLQGAVSPELEPGLPRWSPRSTGCRL